MPDQIIACPQCATQIPLTDALTEKLRSQLKNELSAEVEKKEKELAEKTQILEEEKKKLNEEVNKKIEAEKLKLWEIAQQKASEKVELELKDLKKTQEEKDRKIREMSEKELELRKTMRSLEEKEKELELNLQRKLDEERKLIASEAEKKAIEENRLKIAEKDKQLDQLRRALEEAKRKSEQGSMQIQGDVQEEDLKHLLQSSFPIDHISDVATGIKGADLIQKVNNSFGNQTGIILWESKNTKTWSDEWLKKLKGDQSIVKADVCILVSQALPDEVKDFKFLNGIWVCSYSAALSLATILRLHLIQIGQIKKSLVGKDEKMEILYNYLAGSEFKNRIENIVSAFSSMQSDLESEKRSMERIWKKRGKELERVIMSTSGMYGDLQGIIGASLPTIKSLELPAVDDFEIEENESFLSENNNEKLISENSNKQEELF